MSQCISTTTTQVRLARRQFAIRDGRLSVTLTATAELVWLSTRTSFSEEEIYGEQQPTVDTSTPVLGPYASAARVAQLVRSGRLWVGSGGRAFGLVVYPTLQRQNLVLAQPALGSSNSCGAAGVCADAEADDNADTFLANAILRWPAWEDYLGLDIRLEDKGDRGQGHGHDGDDRWWRQQRQQRQRATGTSRKADAGRLFFSVSHPVSAGGLFAPPTDIPQAQFRQVECHLTYALLSDDEWRLEKERKNKESNRRKSKSKSKSRTKSRPKKTSKTSILERNPSKSSKPVATPSLAHITSDTASRNKQLPRKGCAAAPPTVCAAATALRKNRQRKKAAVNPKPPATSNFRDGTLRLQAATLARASLHALVGIRRFIPGVQCLVGKGDAATNPALSSLIDIAPAVWSYPYFKSVADQAPFVPSISRFLASVTNAQSASLRQKAEAALTCQHDYMAGGGSDCLVRPGAEWLETKLHEILLKLVPRLPRSKRRQRTNADRQGSLIPPRQLPKQSGTPQLVPRKAKEAIPEDRIVSTPEYHLAVTTPLPATIDESFHTDDTTGELVATVEHTDWLGIQYDVEDTDSTCWEKIESWPPELDNWHDDASEGLTDGDTWPTCEEMYFQEDDPSRKGELDGGSEACWQEVEEWQMDAWLTEGTLLVNESCVLDVVNDDIDHMEVDMSP